MSLFLPGWSQIKFSAQLTEINATTEDKLFLDDEKLIITEVYKMMG